MTRPRYPKPDANHAYNNQALRQCGLVVVDVSPLPGKQIDDDTDTLDVFVGDPLTGQWVHVDWKVDGGTLTGRQQRYTDRYGKQLPIFVACSFREVMHYFGRGVQ